MDIFLVKEQIITNNGQPFPSPQKRNKKHLSAGWRTTLTSDTTYWEVAGGKKNFIELTAKIPGAIKIW